jgi:hypothetical protein
VDGCARAKRERLSGEDAIGGAAIIVGVVLRAALLRRRRRRRVAGGGPEARECLAEPGAARHSFHAMPVRVKLHAMGEFFQSAKRLGG